MIDFIKALSRAGCWYGAAIATLYAMVIPGIKLVLLITAEPALLAACGLPVCASWLCR